MRPWLFAAAAAVCLVIRWYFAGKHIDATPLLYAFAPFNVIGFTLRRALSWTRGQVRHENEPKDRLFAHGGSRENKLGARERELRRRFELQPLYDASSAHIYRENLYFLDLLDRHVRETLPSSIRALDVGSQDFRYAFGLSRWLRGHGRDVSLTGIEIDGHPIYPDLHSRKDHAETYAAEIDRSTVDYVVKDFLEFEAADVDVMTFFFPFVLEYALVRWGLPRKHFAPAAIFEHAKRMLRPGGLVIVMNHTAEEQTRQVEILEASGFEIVQTGIAASTLVDYAADVPERSLTVARAPRTLP